MHRKQKIQKVSNSEIFKIRFENHPYAQGLTQELDNNQLAGGHIVNIQLLTRLFAKVLDKTQLAGGRLNTCTCWCRFHRKAQNRA
jgi:hypothetical protein